jgi:hypothetical protein
MQAVVKVPRRPIRCRQRTRGSRWLISRNSSAVPSGESSSTKIISHFTVSSTVSSSSTSSKILSRLLEDAASRRSSGFRGAFFISASVWQYCYIYTL